MKKFILFVIMFLYSFIAQGQKIEISNSEIKTYKSIMVEDQMYEMRIILPNSYSKKSEKYPVIFVLDGQWDTPLVGSLQGQQNYDGFAPESIIVGITWTGEKPNYDSLRRRDFIPSLTENGGGKADKFFNFIAYELIPFMEQTYSIDKNKITLMGSSLGGLFTMYSYFTKPQIFNCYIAASPAINHDKDLIKSIIQKYDKYKKGKKKLYLTYGGVELELADFTALVSELKDQNISNLDLRSDIFENVGHAGTKGITYMRGIQLANERPRLKTNDARLKELAGIYNDKELQCVELYQVLDQLYIKYGNYNLPLYASSQNEFYVLPTNMKLQFFTNMKGFVMTTYGGTKMFKM